MMRMRFVVLLSVLFGIGCHTDPPLDRVKLEVANFARTVAEGVTARGPAAWQDYFEDGAEFFMASEGEVQFADGAAARAAIPGLVRTIKAIQLRWGELRIDPLTQDLAVVAAPWNEVAVLADGKRVDERGYFTGIAERRNGSWRFRNAHWSTARAK
jgi:hypothetical protein